MRPLEDEGAGCDGDELAALPSLLRAGKAALIALEQRVRTMSGCRPAALPPPPANIVQLCPLGFARVCYLRVTGPGWRGR